MVTAHIMAQELLIHIDEGKSIPHIDFVTFMTRNNPINLIHYTIGDPIT